MDKSRSCKSWEQKYHYLEYYLLYLFQNSMKLGEKKTQKSENYHLQMLWIADFKMFSKKKTTKKEIFFGGG